MSTATVSVRGWDDTQCECWRCEERQPPIAPPPEPPYVSAVPTPWAVTCQTHRKVYLTSHGYTFQMLRPDSVWMCPYPTCRARAYWDDDNYDAYLVWCESDDSRV